MNDDDDDTMATMTTIPLPLPSAVDGEKTTINSCEDAVEKIEQGR
jgi:hypothetical protein